MFLLSNAVVLLALLCTFSIFRCDFFHFNFLLQRHSEIRLLFSTCPSLYCSHAKQIWQDLWRATKSHFAIWKP